MIDKLETEYGLEAQAENAGYIAEESAEYREAIVLAFELETAADPANPQDPVEVLRHFISDIRAYLSGLR